MTYNQLTIESRCQIYALKSKGFKQKEIAEYLKVAPSMICRELKRNTGQRGYRYQQAEQEAVSRRRNANCRASRMLSELVAKIEEHLLDDWSPEQISA
jgi:IS30 family transposase